LSQAAPLGTSDRRTLAAIRSALDRLGYTSAGLRRALDLDETLPFRQADLPVHRRRLAEDAPLTQAIRLFWFGDAVPSERVDGAFHPLGVGALEQLGLVVPTADGPQATLRLVPFDGLVLACDRAEYEEPDLVAGLHAPSVLLARLTVRREIKSALDVCAGFGIQALLAARHAQRVVATDVNPRALAFLAFNAALNGFENIEVREGSLFEPVAGERFDLVTCNPPYVISPESRYLYRDSGLEGHSISHAAVSAAPGALCEGGFAHVLASWVRRPGESWMASPESWLQGSGCDAWLLHTVSEDALATAAAWNRPLRAESVDRFDAALEAWLAEYARLGAESIAYGAVCLRRRADGVAWIAGEELLGSPIGPAGDLVSRMFAARDFLGSLSSDSALLDARLRVVEQHRLEQVAHPGPQGYEVESTILTLEDGLEFRGPADALTVEILARCDGRRRLADAIAEATAALGLAADESVEPTLAVVRRLLELGFLEPPAG
jgi:SAM-dependent methyltransferase